MDISSAVAYLKSDDTLSNAAKFPAWPGGYVYKTTLGVSAADIDAGKFRLVFVHSSGDQYIFKWNGVADYAYEGYLAHTGTNDLASLTSGTPSVAVSLPCDADMLEAILSTSWETGAQSTYEARRKTPGLW